MRRLTCWTPAWNGLHLKYASLLPWIISEKPKLLNPKGKIKKKKNKRLDGGT